jgi:putative transcriptional regulator
LIGVNPRRDNSRVRTVVRALCLLAACAAGPAAVAQPHGPPNGVFLVAKPGMQDPNFSETVVLVTQTDDASTVGVIVNRPTRLQLRQFLPDAEVAAKYRDRIYFGGPVMREAIVALFRADAPPGAPAFHVLKNLYLTTHRDSILALLTQGSRQYRLYSGVSGWAPRQLEGEFAREGWYVVPADADSAFRENPEGLWEELVRRAEKRPVGTAGAS